ncbi:uncharacterized protein LOC143080004 isoform X1 [Mytilus galloprovincialis]|uniref:VWFA domain-containing protein n=1 Tax=Mytilus galloprovincialis TaxID=29158 RepID=A0A8B6HQZ2_MYTGA|nr:Hypothetical predicted protein [Mytilus galloprovincialis]
MAGATNRYKDAADEYVSLSQVSVKQDDDDCVPMRPPRSLPNGRGSTGSLPPRVSSESQRLSSKHSSSSSNSSNGEAVEDLTFEEFLKRQGVTKATIQLLEEEEIADKVTLGALSEDDINGLGLKVGQKAILRSLTTKAKSRLPDARNSVIPPPIREVNGTGEVDLQCYCLEKDGKGKVVAEITTKHTNEINPIKTRILILVDTSGSMGIKTGRRRRYSKLYRIKGFAKNMVTSLDDGDFAGLVTFGENADVLLPMTEITHESRDRLKSKLDTLDKSFLSTKTNLSAGLSKALEVFRDASSGKRDLLHYRNAIIVFSDGEVNAGTQEPSKLVHEVREKIRQLSFGLDESLNQWASISTVVLGKSASEIMFCLSKFCSSDAFYTIDMDVDNSNTETDLFLPVLMRKAAVAWNVSVYIESVNGAVLINEDCSQDNKVRTHGQSSRGPKTAKAYFYYDIPAASTRHIGIGVDLEEAFEEEVLKVKVEYSGFSGERKTIIRTITKSDILTEGRVQGGKAITEHYKNDARMLSEEVLGKAAKAALDGNSGGSADAMREGQSELQKLMNRYGDMADKQETAQTEIFDYAKSLMSNFECLLQKVNTPKDEDTDEQIEAESSWLKIKAVSSAISREAPGLAETVSDSNILCPLPDVRKVSSTPMRTEMEKVYKEKGIRESLFFDFDGAIDELKKSIKKDED